jgi:hypothetical protein
MTIRVVRATLAGEGGAGSRKSGPGPGVRAPGGAR